MKEISSYREIEDETARLLKRVTSDERKSINQVMERARLKKNKK